MGRVNETDVSREMDDQSPDADPPFKRTRLGAAAGDEAFGTSLYERLPGTSSWPYHYHTANEEAIYILSGSGILHTPAGESSLEPGDFASFSPDADGAHRVYNPDGADDALRYLVISTMTEPDVTVYPESGTFGVFVGAPPGSRADRTVDGFF